MKNRVNVVFLGKEYSIVTDADKEYVVKIVDYLEQKFNKTVAVGTPITISTPVLLTSLEIVDDFFALQRKFDEFKRNTENKTEELVKLLESSGDSTPKKFILTEEIGQDPFSSRGKSY